MFGTTKNKINCFVIFHYNDLLNICISNFHFDLKISPKRLAQIYITNKNEKEQNETKTKKT